MIERRDGAYRVDAIAFECVPHVDVKVVVAGKEKAAGGRKVD